ncbi:proton-conducting transporter membrane subunit [Novosphingobium sp. FKTRR1]|uniref:proton-conducting transporter transmembrane domain-containing protein n=1 Tax=Novosphingobium sp. FKTRR1 TaxID=2879118 RepID=UPI001CEFF0EB|nr:proton-conducting transporter membrane subunit [Novosphingobium sp. FKTRR1]
MNQTTLTASSRQWSNTALYRLAPRAADLPVIALGAVVVTALALGLATPNTAGMALGCLSVLVTLVVLSFARRQLRADPRAASFARMAVGLVIATVLTGLAGNVLLLVAGWIASGRLMAGMIGHADDWAEARAAARRASLAFAASDLALVGAALLLVLGAGSSDLATILSAVPSMTQTVIAPAAFLLVIAALARCALPPFSSWLMSSLAAPTPVSALMHAGFVNAGGFLLIRLAPVLEAAPSARFTLFAVGIAAAVFGSAIMLVRSDVKGSLAASTIAQMGFMLLTVALGAYAAALWHMVAHGLFKAWLFLGSAGTISSASSRAKALPQPIPAVIALTTLTGALAILQARSDLPLLPLGLACAALLSAFAVGLGAAGRSRLSAVTVSVPVMLIALNAGALGAMAALQPDAGMPLLSPYAQFGLLSLFLAGGVLQQSLASGARSLPPALYARLIHAGTPAA